LSDLKFGITIVPTDKPADFIPISQEIDRMGLDYLWVCDSTLHSYDPYVCLTLAAAHTSKVKLGLNCANPFTRHPAACLNSISSIDSLSNGRARVSFGSGAEPLFELGYARGKVNEVRETVQLAKEMLQKDEVTIQAGPNRLKGATLHYRSRSDIPIYVTASGPKMLEMAGEVADGVIFLSGSYPACVQSAIDHITLGAKKAGRKLEDIDLVWCGVGAINQDRVKAIDESRTLAAWVIKYAPNYATIAGVPKELAEAVSASYTGGHFHEAKAAAALISDEFVERLTLTGSPEDFRRQIAAVAALGVRHIEYEIMGADRLAAARLFARSVVPHFR
jgi:5,10-methylenetetrahydromethanopterin reductase